MFDDSASQLSCVSGVLLTRWIYGYVHNSAWCLTNNATIATGKAHGGTTFQAYSPLGHGKALSNPTVKTIATKYNVSTAQVRLHVDITHQELCLLTLWFQEQNGEAVSLREFLRGFVWLLCQVALAWIVQQGHVRSHAASKPHHNVTFRGRF